MKMSVQVDISTAPGSGRRSKPTALTLYSLAPLMTLSFPGKNNKKWLTGWKPNCTDSLTVATFRTWIFLN
ncbi:RB binding protein 9, serine hydrolase [Phyllostomus discolor]|uniref:RB binding protein 9, serine hydrolase n=1 Tax=Phyllostomus discolor TaxID=89673 RepID=A0A834DQ08_9CHIR|nr:RB binding protein 9, serine hydrolase [Phyllostomus discolor]